MIGEPVGSLSCRTCLPDFDDSSRLKRKGLHMQMLDKIDLLLSDHLEKSLLGTPMHQQILHLLSRINAGLLCLRYKAGTDP